MRILLASHLPPALCNVGVPLVRLATGLLAAGHEVRLAIVLSDVQQAAGLPAEAPVEPIVCRSGDSSADLPFDLPQFEPTAASPQTFSLLSDRQIAMYRDCIRRRLDACIEVFDPHLIHCQQVWLLGHLALESGAPYVLTAQGPELAALRADSRYRRLVEQTVENAGGILAINTSVRGELLALFPDSADLVLLEPPVDKFASVYQAVLTRRFGRH